MSSSKNELSTSASAPPMLEETLIAAVERVIDAAESVNTRRAYNAAFAKYAAWCMRRGVGPLPASPAMVATFLVDLAETGAADSTVPPRPRRLSTVALALSAIAAKHRTAGLDFDAPGP